MTDDDIVEALAVQLWGMNLDRDAHSIARDLLPTVRQLAAPVQGCTVACPVGVAHAHPPLVQA